MPVSDKPLNALLGKGASYEGDLSFDGRVRLDGTFKGRIYTDDRLEIGPTGRVEGEVDVAELVLAGVVDGKIRVRDLMILESSGAVIGEVKARRIQVIQGGKISGKVEVG